MIKNFEETEYYSIKELAKHLKVAYLTVYRWIQSGRLKAYKASKQYRIKVTDVEDFIALQPNKNE